MQTRIAHANAPAASPRLTEDALRLVIDDVLGEMDPTIVVTSGTIDAATAQLEARDEVKSIGGKPQDSVIVGASRTRDSGGEYKWYHSVILYYFHE